MRIVFFLLFSILEMSNFLITLFCIYFLCNIYELVLLFIYLYLYLIDVNNKYTALCYENGFETVICEGLYVTLKFYANTNLHIRVCCVCSPPYVRDDNFLLHLNNINNLVEQCPSYYFLIVGNYNIPGIVWTPAVERGACVASNIVNTKA